MRSPATERPFAQRIRRALAGLLPLAFLAPAADLRAAAIPEPDTVFYGRVLNFDHGHELLVTAGRLDWVIHPDGNGGRSYTIQTTLDPLADGTLSYRLKVPHEALVTGLAATDLSPSSVPLSNTEARFGHAEIQVNGVLARILPPASDVFTVSAERRATAYRLDLEISVPMPDSDGSGLPDWWQRRFFGRLGVDPLADPDADGWNNRREYLAGTDPTAVNVAPAIAWENPSVDEGTTGILTVRAVDSDSAPETLVYTLTEAPAGASVRILPGPDGGPPGGRSLRAGDTFTQRQLDLGALVMVHEDPTRTQFTLGLSLSDGNAAHPPYSTNFTVRVHTPTPVDGTGAAVWLDARQAAARSGGQPLAVWNDRSGPKPWLDGTSAPYDAAAITTPLPLAPLGPLGQPVVALNAQAAAQPQYLSLPSPRDAAVFPPGDITVFAVFNSLARGPARQQVVNGANFQLAVAGDADRGRAGQVRFASEDLGVVYGNHRIQDQWTLATAWRGQRELNLELYGAWVGGPRPLDEPVSLGTGAAVGARDTDGHLAEPFQGLLAELLVFNRSLVGGERQRINAALASKWFGWVILDGSEEERDVVRRVPTSGLSTAAYRTNFVPRYGPDRHYVLIGGGGKDLLQGGQEADVIVGGRQADVMTGGGGADRFVFTHEHIHPGDDVITDFDPSVDHDLIDLSDLLRGQSRDLRDYLRLRTDGHSSYLDLDLAGTGRYTNHTIVLQNTVLRDEDRYALWSGGNLLTGDKRFPIAATVTVARGTALESADDAAVLDVRFTGGSGVPAGLEIPFTLGGTARRDVDYTLQYQRLDPADGAYHWVPVVGQVLAAGLRAGDLGFGVRVVPIPNRRSDAVRTVEFSLTPVPEFYDAQTAPVTVQIVDAPQRAWVVAEVSQAIPGGAPGVFRLSRDGSLDVPLDVVVRLTGPAVNGTDYAYVPASVHFEAGRSNAWVNVVAVLDENVRPARAAELVLEPGAGYLVDPARQSATVTIQPSLPLITVEAYEPLAIRGDGTPGSFLFRRLGPASGTVTVLFEVSGTGVMGRDYQRFNRWVVFAPGTTLVLVPVTALDGVGPVGIKTVGVRLIPDGGFNLGAAQSAEVRLVGSGITFAVWRAGLFPPDSTPADVFSVRDFDGDGLVNLIEYAFGSDPKVPDAGRAGHPRAVVVDGRLGVRFTRPVAATDLEYRIETSSDLATWFPANDSFDRVSSVLRDVGNEEVTWLSHASVAGLSGGQFVRVRVQLR